MLEAAEQQELKPFLDPDSKKSRKSFEETLVPVLPYYHLIEKIRIHDFHRFGCVPPDPKYHMVLYGGPSKLVANQGAAVLAILSEGPEFTLTGNSQIKGQRPLCVDDGQFFDEASGRYLSLENILGEYLSAMPATISKFAQLLSRQ